VETPDPLAQGEMDYQVIVVDNQLGHRVEDTRADRRPDQSQRQCQVSGPRTDIRRSQRLATSRADLLEARLSGTMYPRHVVPPCSVDASDSGRADAGQR
jgi:hypothetical protein